MSLRAVMAALLVLAAVALGLIAVQVSGPSRTAHEPAPAPVMPGPTASYLVAARSLPPGTLVHLEDFTIRTVPATDVPPGAIIDSEQARAGMRGALLRRFVEAGTPPRAADLVRPRDHGFLDAVLTAGMRAVSIGVDPVSGVAGLIWPGDRVDVILTQDRPSSGGDARRIVTSETILAGSRVIAVDQGMVQAVPAAGSVGKPAATVTLEVGSDQAEKIAAAAHMGRLSLAARPIADDNRPLPVAPVVISGPRGSEPMPTAAGGAASATVLVIEGSRRDEVKFK